MKQIPSYKINNFKHVHRIKNSDDSFGYTNLSDALKLKNFALYSTKGAKEVISPTKADFYRISICLSGTAKVTLGLESFIHKKRAISFTFPNQLFSKEYQSDDFFGYYLFFTSNFLGSLIRPTKFEGGFSFFLFSGVPFFKLNYVEFERIKGLFEQIDQELKLEQADRAKAIQLYLYLLLIEAKRSYRRQKLSVPNLTNQPQVIVYRFKKLVSEHFLTYRNVSDYAAMLAITPNYLNRMIKQETSTTASYFINQMLLTEARALLKHSDLNITEIAHHLSFTDLAHFSKFFKQHMLISPSQYRKNL